jgi:acyl-CoA dehydrogenase
MNFQLSEEHRAIQDLIRKFVQDELLPLEPLVLEREASGHHEHLTSSEIERLRGVAQELGLYGLDAPADVGGVELPELAMIAVNEEMGKTITPFVLPPDSPNLRMLMNAADERQKEAYLAPSREKPSAPSEYPSPAQAPIRHK